MNDYKFLKAEIAKVKRYRGLTNSDLARMTGYKKNTIDVFMSEAPRPDREDSKNVAEALIAALKLEV
jgi:DNA-binding phage protein